jgi:cytochrome b561
MTELPKSPPGLRAGWFNVHKSIGMTLGLFILLRLVWRWTSSTASTSIFLSPKERVLAKLGHLGLYVGMICVPLTGFLGSSFSKYPIKYFGIELPKFFIANDSLKDLMKELHEASVTLLILIILIHVAAVIKHLFWDKENILKRMWF